MAYYHSIPIYFRLPSDLNRKLRALAAAQDRSMASLLRTLVRRAVEEDILQNQSTSK